jgi:quercetin dioxygenase-like cupin family protein
MTAFSHVDELVPHVIWPGVVGRNVTSELTTFSYLELDPDTHVPEHEHVNEQVGVLVRGSVRFRIGDEVRELTPGSTWCIHAHVPHEVWSGPEGASLVEVFAPRREDWGDREQLVPSPAVRFPG